jgi:hypothetical protein
VGLETARALKKKEEEKLGFYDDSALKVCPNGSAKRFPSRAEARRKHSFR